MRVAVMSDVHANYRALEAVLEEIDRESVDAVWCLGDTVGYGPLPNECCAEVEGRSHTCLVGNHDLVVLGELSVEEFNHEAAAAAIWTAEVLSDDSRRFLQRLEPAGAVDGVDLFHASARDPIWEYGHSHVALALTIDGDQVAGGLAPAETEVQLEGRWLLNPGSVGQPRDGDPRAAWLLLDLERMFAFFRRVEYPIQETQRELRELGLPPSLAARLARGE
jgi:predicted phosphodiesterase